MSENYRSPVVVVLGHVDHGKTTLLDYIRKTHKADREVGGITQHIGAYEVEIDKKDYHSNRITFIDTPGHEAFTRLRLQGAQVADIAILVVDAVDSLMPQTTESIFHIKNAGIPFVVAINKIDMPGANIEKVKKDLLKAEVMVEGLGGDVPVVPISAKSGEGVDVLLDTILFMASIKDLRYDPLANPKAYIIESTKENAGISVTIIIKDGVIQVGDILYAGNQEVKVRALFSDTGKHLAEIIPSSPAVLLGFKEIPEVGGILSKEQEKDNEETHEIKKTVIDPTTMFIKDESKKLRLILKTDAQGSLDAIVSSLTKNDNVEMILAGIGDVAKSDIFLAKISKAIVIGFNASPDKNVTQLAKEEKVIIKTYNIIYELLDELNEVSHLINEKEQKEKNLKGEAKVIATFIIEKEHIAGIQVTKGKIGMNDMVELLRNGKIVAETKIVSLRQRAKTVPEIKKNDEGGVLFYPVLDFMVGDVIQSYSI